MARTKKPARKSMGGQVYRSESSAATTDTTDSTTNHQSNKKRCIYDVYETDDQVHFTVDRRQDDFNKRTWWMVDICNYESNQGATALVKRCTQKYDWNLDETKEILQAYRQFLQLKTEVEDWDGSLLAPSTLVNQMWQEHVLDIGNYLHDILILCDGQVLLQESDGASDQEAFETRKERTRAELIKEFGVDNVNSKVWGFPSESATKSFEPPDIETILKTIRENYQDVSDTDELDISFLELIAVANKMSLRLSLLTTMRSVMKTYAHRRGMEASALHFSYNEKIISPYDTLQSLDMKSDDIIVVRTNPAKPITIFIKEQHQNDEVKHNIHTNTCLGPVLEEYAKRKGKAFRDIRFTDGCKTISYGDTLALLEFLDEEHICISFGTVEG